jgi:hypothetical protein
MPLFPTKEITSSEVVEGNVILNGNEVSPAVSRARRGLTTPISTAPAFSYPASPPSDSPPIRQRKSPSDKECHCMLMIYSMRRCPPSYSFQTFRLCACRVSDLSLTTFERPDHHPNRRTTLHSIKPCHGAHSSQLKIGPRHPALLSLTKTHGGQVVHSDAREKLKFRYA